jgi:hypothetical protein
MIIPGSMVEIRRNFTIFVLLIFQKTNMDHHSMSKVNGQPIPLLAMHRNFKQDLFRSQIITDGGGLSRSLSSKTEASSYYVTMPFSAMQAVFQSYD